MKVKCFLGPLNNKVIDVANFMPEICIRLKPVSPHYVLKFSLLFPDYRKTLVRYARCYDDHGEVYYVYIGDEGE